jgi:hypothetical protein
LCLNHGEFSAKNPTWAVRQIGICTETFSFRDAAQKFGLTAASMWQNRLDFYRIVRIAVCVGGSARRRRPLKLQAPRAAVKLLVAADSITLDHRTAPGASLSPAAR